MSPSRQPSPVSEEWLRKHYIEEGWSIERISKEIGKSDGFTRRLIAEAGISVRHRGPIVSETTVSPKPTGIVCPECGHEFQENLREVRIAKGMTQGELAEKCGVHMATISKVERGIHGASPTLRLELARHLGIPYANIPISGRVPTR